MKRASGQPQTARQQRRVRYLKLIALFKLSKGVILLTLGFSLLFLNSRTRWLDSISGWADDELLLSHSRPITFLLNKLQDALAAGHLRATALLALFYSGVLFTEGIGVYLQKRWAEFLMVIATAALVPIEVRHIFHRPSLTAFVILAVNCFIVWFLCRVLRRDHHAAAPPAEREVAVETR